MTNEPRQYPTAEQQRKEYHDEYHDEWVWRPAPAMWLIAVPVGLAMWAVIFWVISLIWG